MIPIIFVGRRTYHLAPAAGKSTCLFSEMSQNWPDLLTYNIIIDPRWGTLINVIAFTSFTTIKMTLMIWSEMS